MWYPFFHIWATLSHIYWWWFGKFLKPCDSLTLFNARATSCCSYITHHRHHLSPTLSLSFLSIPLKLLSISSLLYIATTRLSLSLSLTPSPHRLTYLLIRVVSLGKNITFGFYSIFKLFVFECIGSGWKRLNCCWVYVVWGKINDDEEFFLLYWGGYGK